MKKYNCRVVYKLVFIFSLILIICIAHYIGYARGFEEGNKELKNYKQENYIFYSAWDKPDIGDDYSSEYLDYNGTELMSARMNHDFYHLRWNNYFLSDEGFEMSCTNSQGKNNSCVLVVVNNSCAKSTNPLINPYSCFRVIQYRMEEEK